MTITLSFPQLRIRVADAPGRLGRATAEFEDDDNNTRRWDAKHAWDEGIGPSRTRVFEFDEPLPAREIRVRIGAR